MAMVSNNNHSQYLSPDFMSPMTSTAEPGKSPLAMLAQTCQSIGLPETTSQSKNGKDGHNKAGSPKNGNSLSSLVRAGSALDENGNHKSAADRNGLMPGMPPGFAAMRGLLPPGINPSLYAAHHAAAAAAASSYNPHAAAMALAAAAYASPAMSAGAFGPFGLAGAQFPGARLPCVDPTCKSCPPGMLPPPPHGRPGVPCPLGCVGCGMSGGASDYASMMLNPYTSLLAAQYPGLTPGGLPGMSLASSLAAVSAASTSSQPSTSSNGVVPSVSAAAPSTSAVVASTSTPLPSTAAAAAAAASPNHPHVCNWADDNVPCGQRFASADELYAHLQSHARSPAKSSGSESSSEKDRKKDSKPNSPKSEKSATDPTSVATTTAAAAATPSPSRTTANASTSTCSTTPTTSSHSYLNALRFHPYGKPPSVTSAGLLGPMLPPPPPVSVGPSPFSPYAAALSALYGQRLPGSLPHP